MKIKHTNYRAFTLLETLIATSIFAIVMVLSTGIVAQSAGYQRKIEVTRKVSEESRRLAEMISADLRIANAEGTVKAKESGSYPAYTYKNGVALLNCELSAGACSFRHYQDDETGNNGLDASAFSNSIADDYQANTLVIFYKKSDSTTGYKIYFADGGVAYYLSGDGNSVTLSTNVVESFLYPTTIVTDSNKISSAANYSIGLKFGGFAPSSSAANIYQPYILYDLNVETAGYSTIKEVYDKSKAHLRSGVTVRSYNQ